MLNKDFLKLVLKNEKALLKMSEVSHINVPAYDELAIKKIYPFLRNDQNFMRYFPDKLPKGRLPDREYFWNVLNTVNGPYVAKVIRHASDLRHSAAQQQEADQVI